MNKKGEVNSSIGTLLLVAVGVIVGLILLSAVANTVSTSTTTGSVKNTSLTLAAAGSKTSITGAQAISSVILINATSGELLGSTNYTIANYDPVNGQALARLQSNAGLYAGTPVNASYSYEPIGYATDSGSRTVILLIVVFGALAIAVFTLYPAMKSIGEMGIGV